MIKGVRETKKTKKGGKGRRGNFFSSHFDKKLINGNTIEAYMQKIMIKGVRETQKRGKPKNGENGGGEKFFFSILITKL